MEKLIGRYGILANLAKTRYGAVYVLAGDRRKLLCYQILAAKVRAADVETLREMVDLSLQQSHENVLNCKEVITTSQGWNLIYEYFDHPTLVEVLSRDLDWQTRLSMIWQIREIVKYLSSRGESHGYFRARNFLFDAKRGALKVFDSVASSLPLLYADKEDIEEFKYWPPQELGGSPTGAKGDVWSAALVIWEIVFGRSAFPLNTANKQVFLAEVFHPIDARPAPTPELTDLLLGCLVAREDARFSPEEFYNHKFFAARASRTASPRRANAFDYLRERVFELEVVRRSVAAALALITHNWKREFVQYYRGLVLLVLNKAIIRGDNLLRCLQERANVFELSDFDRIFDDPRALELLGAELRRAHCALKDIDDATLEVFVAESPSKNYANEVRAVIFRHLADAETFKAFAKQTHAFVRRGFAASVEEEQIVEVKHALKLFEYILSGKVIENIEEF